MLENPQRRIVGIASLTEVDSYFEQHVQVLDFFASPAYLHQLPALLAALVEQARANGSAEILQAYVASVDAEKRRLLEGAGFQMEAQLRERLQVGNERADLLIYGLSFRRRAASLHPASAYYGMRAVSGPSSGVG